MQKRYGLQERTGTFLTCLISVHVEPDGASSRYSGKGRTLLSGSHNPCTVGILCRTLHLSGPYLTAMSRTLHGRP